MKKALIAAALTGVFVMPAFAADTNGGQHGQGQSIEQKKAEILQHIDERIANSQAEKTCVQSAQSHDALRACRDKYRPKKPQDDRQNKTEPSM